MKLVKNPLVVVVAKRAMNLPTLDQFVLPTQIAVRCEHGLPALSLGGTEYVHVVFEIMLSHAPQRGIQHHKLRHVGPP